MFLFHSFLCRAVFWAKIKPKTKKNLQYMQYNVIAIIAINTNRENNTDIL